LESTTSISLYLELLKRSLTFLLYAPCFLDIQENDEPKIIRPSDSHVSRRIEGRDWPGVADTMIGLYRLNNLQYCLEQVLASRVPGDVIECGVWRGGAAIFLRGLLKAHGVTDRCVWLADSFCGLPAPNAEKYPADREMTLHLARYLAVPLAQVRANFSRYGLLDDQVRFVEGWFRDTLPALNNQTWSLMRLDGDMYESTIDALVNLYPNLSPGGFVIIDDYADIPACRQAVHDFRERYGISEEIQPIDWSGAFWQKGENQLQVTIRHQQMQLDQLRSELEFSKKEAAASSATLEAIMGSTSWHTLQRWRTFRDRLIPSGSYLRRIYDRLLGAFRPTH
jgi:Macrocin-O-methyltransferase (TylF)